MSPCYTHCIVSPSYCPTTCHPAWCVQALLDVGATVVGKTHMDELAYSLNGENYHYGTPTNVAAPGRIPGGSSSGSAVGGGAAAGWGA
jgi:amidase